MPNTASVRRVAADAAAPLPPAAVVSANTLIGQGIARLVERAAVASAVDVCESLRGLDPVVGHGIVVLHAPSVDTGTLVDVAQARSLHSTQVVAVVMPPAQGGSLAAVLAAGADILLAGTETPEALRDAVASVGAGFGAVSKGFTRALALAPIVGGDEQATIYPASGPLGSLTPQQRTIAALIAQGLPNAAIARRLHISEGTVKVHITAIFRGTKVRSRTELVCHLLGSVPRLAGTTGGPP
ncbi:response regulator transcription factor [Azospirillum sp. YIM DDC1]|uniref:Response regulator transcription factor n=1 Tax=Azospirillum aestuarii TaxID=2802052 RepID=A0ABS1HRV3_9PROT|nr:response regulator transcription factor [Azospirillum aestuarii]MBK4717547.1 response regulator transcription factor [Azospirillum aestuarii]